MGFSKRGWLTTQSTPISTPPPPLSLDPPMEEQENPRKNHQSFYPWLRLCAYWGVTRTKSWISSAALIGSVEIITRLQCTKKSCFSPAGTNATLGCKRVTIWHCLRQPITSMFTWEERGFPWDNVERFLRCFSLCFLVAVFTSPKMKRLRENNNADTEKKEKLILFFSGLFIAVVPTYARFSRWF